MNEKPNKKGKIALKILPWILVVILVVVFALWRWLDTRVVQHTIKATQRQVLYDTTGLRTGDLVFRNGLGNESMMVTSASNGDYSHIGIAYDTPQGWYVIHAVPGEAEEGQPEYLKFEPIGEFYHPERAMAGAVVRVDCSDDKALAAARYAMFKRDQKVEFDNDYNMDDTTQLYCTELVQMCYLKQGIDLIEDRYDHAAGFGKSNRVMYPEHVLQSRYVKNKKIFKAAQVEIE